MSDERGQRADFSFSTEGVQPETLVVGFAELGLAGLTAVDYLAEQRAMDETGHLTVDQLPAITPFEDGTPRHHTRVFSGENGFAVLVGELAIPLGAAPDLADATLSWAERAGVSEVTICSGVPVPHGPDEHGPFFVATDDYRERRLDGDDVDLDPMGTGFLEGFSAELMGRGMDSDLRVGVLTTPVHQPAPDAEAAIRLLDALGSVYDVDVDTGPLEEFAAQVRTYYEDLAERTSEQAARERSEDRMYM